jgi:hypothetical protein
MDPQAATTAARTAVPSTAKKAFALGIAAYVVAWVGVFVFMFRVFGMGGAIVLSLVLAYPLFVAVRMHLRWPTVRGREFAFLLLLLAIVIGGSGGVIWRCYDQCIDLQHAQDL